MRSQLDVVAFDLDGTLIDSKPSIVFGLQMLLQDLGRPAVPDKRLRKLIGIPLAEIFYHLGIHEGEYEQLRSIYSRWMFMHMRGNLRAFSGVMLGLRKLKDSGLKLAIVTSRGHDSLIPCLELAGIDPNIFDTMVAREDTRKHKPSPEPLLHAVAKLGAKLNRVLYVGDALVDVACAKAAGCRALFAIYDADDFLAEAHQDYVSGIAKTFYDVVDTVLMEDIEALELPETKMLSLS